MLEVGVVVRGVLTRAVLRHRRAGVPELIAALESGPARAPLPGGPGGGAGLDEVVRVSRALRVRQRMVCGFTGPLRESALLAVALRRLGYPARLVIGTDPVPDSRPRPLGAWVEIDRVAGGTGVDGVVVPSVVSTSSPVQTWFQVVASYPERVS
ncbi:hypothetical protein CTZ27_38185 [Streptomyces griseocarneus]|nr:hypothetical protein CTZ27_38185 [Streptomyces griseocarneus]